jgi:hypothetical protein
MESIEHVDGYTLADMAELLDTLNSQGVDLSTVPLLCCGVDIKAITRVHHGGELRSLSLDNEHLGNEINEERI